MPTYEVEHELLVAVRVKVRVEAGDKDEAIDIATDLMPNKVLMRESDWKAKVTMKAPKGTTLVSTKPFYFDLTSGGEKARKVG